MDLFKLLGTIAIDNSEANKALDDTSDKGSQTESKLSKAFGAVGKGAAVAGKAIATGLAAGAAAMGALTVKALGLSGELEQNMGGSEAVFGEYAGKMQETAKQAFSNMGLSTSEYLATANKMGALFQGAGFSVEESMNLSSSAMQRAADVASIMGIDTASAMEAVAGAAKGNFTMMDNLGVAMNDTTLNAYALEKGLNKTTAEMTQQEKTALAMEMFMDKTAYAAGNYAKENETLAGSLGTAKAALTNFLDGSGDVDSLVSAFSNAANVIVSQVGEILPRLTTGLTDLVNQVLPLLPPLLQQALPVLIEGATSLINGVVTALPALLDVLINTALPQLLSGVVTIFNAIVSALPSLIKTIVSALPKLIPQLVNGLVSAFVTLCNYLPQIIQPLIMSLPSIIMSLLTALLQNLPVILQGIVTLITSLVAMLPTILPVLIQMLISIIQLLVEQIPVILPMLISAIVFLVQSIIQQLPTILMALIKALPQILKAVWDAIVMIFTNLPQWFGQLFEGAVELIKVAFHAVVSFFQGIWDGIADAFGFVGEFFGNIFSAAWDAIKLAFDVAVDYFKMIWNNIKAVFSVVKNVLSGNFREAWEAIKSIFSNVGSFFTGIWDKIKNAFSAIGTKIGDAISGAVKGAINGILSQAEKIINGFLGMINGAIDLINKIPNVNISKVKLVSFTRLAEGGVVDKPTPAVFGEDGAEAVVPLEKNQGWLRKVAQNLHSFIGETAPNKESIYNYPAQSGIKKADADSVRADVESMKDLLDNILDRLDRFFPYAQERMERPIPAIVGVDQAADALANPINHRLGQIAIMKGRGR